ncbi:MAG: VWA domain-containing protein [Myxococcota bacterium]
MNLDALHVANPAWVHGLWLWPLFAAALGVLERRGRDRLGRLVAPALEPRLVEGPARWRRMARVGLLALAGLAMVVALMRPQWGERFVAAPRVGAEIMIALDVSRSMLADDARPSRLERAKAEISDLLAYLGDDQVGLIAFAGRASVLSPLTPDKSFLRLALESAGPHSVSRGGTRLAEPILRAVAGLGRPGPAQRALILITDGEDQDSFALDAAKKAADAGIKIITIGFGDEAGRAISVRNPEDGSRTLVRDADGQPVVSRLNGELLREIALATDGAYVPAGTGVLDLASIYDAHIARLTRGQLDARGRTIRGETHPIFVALALAALVAAVSITAGGRIRSQAPAVRAERGGRATYILLFFTASLIAVGSAAPVRAAVDAPASAAGGERVVQAAEPVAPRQEDEALGGGRAGRVAPPAADGRPETARVEETPRERFNRANARLAEGDAAAASVLYREARRDATDDQALRYAASYNLGMAAVAQADGLEREKPAEALALLHEAADWFREAAAMEPDETDPRHNLDVVLRRALILADAIARRGQRDVEGELDRLIEQQRARVAESAVLLDAVARTEASGQGDGWAPAFDAAATAQRALLAEAETVADRVADEKAIIESRPEAERAPEDVLRGASLEGVLAYLDQAAERMGQTRGQLRRRSAERAYRRGAEALTQLKRARDQLRDPVEQLGVLMAEVAGLAQATARRADGPATDGAAEGAARPGAATAAGVGRGGGDEPIGASGTEPAVRLPAFLTPESIAAETGAAAARVRELAERFERAADQAAASLDAAGASTEATAADADAEALREALIAAAPLVRRADEAMAHARVAAEAADFSLAVEAEGEVVATLGAARERFLDLRALIAVAHATQTEIAGLATSDEAQAKAVRARAPSALVALQEKNRARATRLEALLGRERARAQAARAAADSAGAETGQTSAPPTGEADANDALAQRFDRATSLLAEAEAAMDDTRTGLAARSGSGEPDWARVAPPATRAAERLDALRQLFFSLVEQLERLARDQVDLGDRTREALALDVAEGVESTRVRADALATEQGALETQAGAIADALLARATAAASDEGSTPGAQGGSATVSPSAGPDADTLRRAAELVATAQLSMRAAASDLDDEARPLEGVPPVQEDASASLREALALLSPPPSESEPDASEQDSGAGRDESSDSAQQGEDPGASDQGEQGDRPDDGASEADARDGGSDEQGGAAGADAAAQAGEDRRGLPGARDPAQLLQGVRDREAERRETAERRAREQRRSAPVEKDW